MYHFQADDEGYAWRVIGLAARLSMELGLHRRETYNKLFVSDEERATAVKLFWSIYVLDRRWSFGTGMPFALQDADIDPLLPKPVCRTIAEVSDLRRVPWGRKLLLTALDRTIRHLT